MRTLKDKVAIVTGGSSGIGKAIALRLGKEGAKIVIVFDRNEKGAIEVARDIEQGGSKAIVVKADISKSADVKKYYDACEEAFGRPDIVCNNAGVATMLALKDTTEEEYERVYGINVRGLLFSLRESASRLKDQGRIVNTSSSTTMFITANTAIYASSKAAVKAITESAAQEFGSRGITVNSIMPGVTETPMTEKLPPQIKKQVIESTPAHRIGLPDDLADVVAFLVSEDARWINGQHILVNGGGKV